MSTTYQGRIPTTVIYIAIVLRMAAWLDANPSNRESCITLTLAFGLLLIIEPWLTRSHTWFPYAYLVIQTGIAMALIFITSQDFIPALFLPLSFQAVQFFKRKLGFLWIGLFTIATIVPLMVGWNWQIMGLVMVLLTSGGYILMGLFADLTQQAESKRLENQRLYGELQKAYRQLQDDAVQAEELVAAQERHHMARELHDSVTQTLFSMNLTVQAARMIGDKDPSRVAGQLERLQSLAKSAAAEIQVLSSQLRSRSISEIGLTSALELLAAERSTRDGLEIKTEINGDKNLAEPVALGLYRIVQESLNNIAKHAGNCTAILRLNLDSQPAYLEVVDNGCGFDIAKIQRSMNHVGLPGMAERARELGWKLSVNSQPGHGTCVRVEENEYVLISQL